MNIVFISEQGFVGKVPDDHTNMRTEYGWMRMLDAFHLPYNALNNVDYFSVLESSDFVILMPSKNNPHYMTITAFNLKKMNKKFGVMQEASRNFWLDMPIEQQINYLAIIQQMANIVFVHNNDDKLYYETITKKPVIVMPTVQYIEPWVQKRICPRDKEERIFIGGNMVRWYGGMNSYLAIKDLPFKTIVFPSMGRKQTHEEQILKQLDERVVYIPYLEWTEFMLELNKCKYAIHLMPEHAAGSFSLNCAILGIPCVGPLQEDTQGCFAELAIDVFNPALIVEAKELVFRLQNEQDFYDNCVTNALQRVKKFDINYQKKELIKSIEMIINGK